MDEHTTEKFCEVCGERMHRQKVPGKKEIPRPRLRVRTSCPHPATFNRWWQVSRSAPIKVTDPLRSLAGNKTKLPYRPSSKTWQLFRPPGERIGWVEVGEWQCRWDGRPDHVSYHEQQEQREEAEKAAKQLPYFIARKRGLIKTKRKTP